MPCWSCRRQKACPHEPLHTMSESSRLSWPAVMAAGALIVWAPLIRGGNRHVALMALEWLALLTLLGLLHWALRQHKSRWGTDREQLALITVMTAPLWIGLLQLLPLPPALWSALPGRAEWALHLQAVGAYAADTWHPLSLTPDATWSSVLAGLPLVACFGLALALSARQLRRFTRLWIAIATVQAVMGLLQLGPLPGLRFDSLFGGAIGTFANNNHFASFIAMTLPLVVMELRRALYEASSRRQQRAAAMWGLALFVLLSAWLASGSRGAMASGLLVLAATWLLLPVSRESKMARWQTAGFVAALLLALAAVGLDGVGRFFGERLVADASVRTLVREATWQAAMDFWPAGSGLGSFGAIFVHYQPASIAEFVPHAHSDYVQLLMELGLLALPLAAAALYVGLQRGRVLWAAARNSALDDEGRRLAACALGLLALLLHAWVDFNLRIPANAMLGAFLAGALCRRWSGKRADIGDSR